MDCQTIILESKHVITKQLLKDYHKKMMHGNHNAVLNEVRQRFWVTKLRATLKSKVTNCEFCKLRRSKPITPVTCELPEARMSYH